MLVITLTELKRAAEGLETQYGGNPAAPEKHLSRLLGYASSSQALGQLQNTCRTALQLTGQLETATAVHACLQGILHQRVDSILGELSSAGAAQAVQVCLEQRYPAQAIAAGSLRIPKPKDFQEAAQDLALLQSEGHPVATWIHWKSLDVLRHLLQYLAVQQQTTQPPAGAAAPKGQLPHAEPGVQDDVAVRHAATAQREAAAAASIVARAAEQQYTAVSARDLLSKLVVGTKQAAERAAAAYQGVVHAAREDQDRAHYADAKAAGFTAMQLAASAGQALAKAATAVATVHWIGSQAAAAAQRASHAAQQTCSTAAELIGAKSRQDASAAAGTAAVAVQTVAGMHALGLLQFAQVAANTAAAVESLKDARQLSMAASDAEEFDQYLRRPDEIAADAEGGQHDGTDGSVDNSSQAGSNGGGDCDASNSAEGSVDDDDDDDDDDAADDDDQLAEPGSGMHDTGFWGLLMGAGAAGELGFGDDDAVIQAALQAENFAALMGAANDW